jgi:hyaluronoglucosaminidase
VTWAIRGVIEGFYGAPWSWDDRRELMRWCHARGMTHYLYAPKDDPLHRERWREPYPAETVRAFEGLVAEGTLAVGFALSPGLSIDYRSRDDRLALARKVDRMVDAGVTLVCLALDDIPPRPGLGVRHAELTTWLADHLGDEVGLVLVPTEYTGTAATPYLEALAEGVPGAVPIAWTGGTVVCDRITAAEAAARASALGGRPPMIWDNYPVNDAFMADRLFLGPLEGRDPALPDHCSGYLANPMVQARASRLPLASVAAYLRGDDPQREWEREAEALGLRHFADACDGRRPRALVRMLVEAEPARRVERLDALAAWVELASDAHTAGDLPRAEVGPWLEQLGHELGLCSSALRLLRALRRGDVARATEEGLGIAYLWPRVRRGDRSVMGPRCSFRPVLDQGPDGTWRYQQGSLREDENATDALMRYALHALADTGRA